MRQTLACFILLLALVPLGLTQPLTQRFQHLLDSAYQANPEAIGLMIHVESPGHQLSWTAVVGFSDRQAKIPLRPHQPVLIASNTKSYVAASILKLVELQVFTLHQPIKKLLKSTTRGLLKKRGYKLDEITLSHLLSHTSGIRDYVDDAYFEFVDTHPQYQWTRDQQIRRTTELGPPLASPGEAFSYGDINYVLLTEIMERRLKQPFYESMRQLLDYEGLNLTQTWFKDLEAYPEGTLPLAHQYAEKFEWDSYELNPSWDLYGGGGIASTVKESALFYQYLFTGKIIQTDSILEKMYTYVLPTSTSNYCLGIRNIPLDSFRIYYHGGFWGTDVTYSPETGSSVAVFTLEKAKRNQLNPFLGKRIQQLLLIE